MSEPAEPVEELAERLRNTKPAVVVRALRRAYPTVAWPGPAEWHRVDLDLEALEKLAALGLTVSDVAEFFEVSRSTMYRRLREPAYQRAWSHGQSKVKIALRRAQLQQALGGNVRMLIWLGKQMLGQKDEPDPPAPLLETDDEIVIDREEFDRLMGELVAQFQEEATPAEGAAPPEAAPDAAGDGSRPGAADPEPGGSPPAVPAEATGEREANGETATEEAETPAPAPPSFDVTKLTAAGLPVPEVDRLRISYQEMVRESDPLLHRAARLEIEKGEVQKALTELRDRYRGALGDKAYDWMLYAGGVSNRVGIRDIYDASPAQGAGLRVGDLVFRYASERLFAKEDLMRAVGAGKPGSLARLVFLREGEAHEILVPAGPLGLVAMDIQSEPTP